MINIEVSGNNVYLTEIKLNIFGKKIIKNLQKFDLKETTWLERLKNEEVVLTIPDNKVYLHRFDVPLDVTDRAVKTTLLNKVNELIPVSVDDLIFDYKRVYSQTFVFIAILISDIISYLEILSRVKLKLIAAIPSSLTAFEVIKETVGEKDIIIYVNSNKECSTITFFDKYGPITTLTQLIRTEEIINGINQAIVFFGEKYKKPVNKIIVNDEDGVIDLAQIIKSTNLPVSKITDYIQRQMLKKKIVLDKEMDAEPNFINIFCLTSYLDKNNELNLFKRDNRSIIINQLNSNKNSLKEKKPEAEGISVANKKNSLLIIFLAMIIFGIIVLGYSRINQGSSKKQIKKIADQKPLTPITLPTSEPDKSKITIQIQNGSGKAGVAKELVDYMKSKGYEQDIATGNADSYDYEKTIVKSRKETAVYQDIIIDDIKNEYQASKSADFLTDGDNYDIVIIIGKE